MPESGSGLSNQMTAERQNGSGMEERVHALETGQAVQGAMVAGMEATQSAAMAGAEATQGAIQAGNMATTTAMQAGNMATMVTGSVGFVVGVFLGLAISATRR